MRTPKGDRRSLPSGLLLCTQHCGGLPQNCRDIIRIHYSTRDAGKILSNPNSTKKEMEGAASDLAQRKGAKKGN